MLIAAIRMALYLLANAPDRECEQAIVDACIDTAAPDGSTSCMSEDLPVLSACGMWPLPEDDEHDLAHRLCEIAVYAVLCSDCADDEATTSGENAAEVLCRNEAT